MNQIGTKTSVDNAQIYSSKQELLKFLKLKENFLYGDFSKKYSEIEKPKKNGGTRIINPPYKNLKTAQRLILDEILIKEPILPCVYGLSKEKGILANAKIHHKKCHQLLVLDIENFFPSIKRNDILKVFIKLGFNKETAVILTKICTVNDQLPQGAPTSPYLSSLVSEKLDKDIFRYCKKRKLIYTRYFDDIAVSGENITDGDIEFIEQLISKNSFVSNSEKKDFYAKDSEKLLNGVLLKNNELSVPDSYKEKIENAYNTFKQTQDDTHKRIFKGLLGFFSYINKSESLSFLENLKKKY